MQKASHKRTIPTWALALQRCHFECGGATTKKSDWTPEIVSFAGNLPVSIATLAEHPGYSFRIAPHPVVIAGVFANKETLAPLCALLLGLVSKTLNQLRQKFQYSLVGYA